MKAPQCKPCQKHQALSTKRLHSKHRQRFRRCKTPAPTSPQPFFLSPCLETKKTHTQKKKQNIMSMGKSTIKAPDTAATPHKTSRLIVTGQGEICSQSLCLRHELFDHQGDLSRRDEQLLSDLKPTFSKRPWPVRPISQPFQGENVWQSWLLIHRL